jgi:hypothetical protein
MFAFQSRKRPGFIPVDNGPHQLACANRTNDQEYDILETQSARTEPEIKLFALSPGIILDVVFFRSCDPFQMQPIA